MLPEYYAARGWDEQGIPTAETKQRLGMKPRDSIRSSNCREMLQQKRRDAAELMKQIGVVIARSDTLSDREVTDAMEVVLTDYLLGQRRNCPVCHGNVTKPPEGS